MLKEGPSGTGASAQLGSAPAAAASPASSSCLRACGSTSLRRGRGRSRRCSGGNIRVPSWACVVVQREAMPRRFPRAASSVWIRVHPWLKTRDPIPSLITTSRFLNRRTGSSVKETAVLPSAKSAPSAVKNSGVPNSLRKDVSPYGPRRTAAATASSAAAAEEPFVFLRVHSWFFPTRSDAAAHPARRIIRVDPWASVVKNSAPGVAGRSSSRLGGGAGAAFFSGAVPARRDGGAGTRTRPRRGSCAAR